jgi:hypothetical protein
MVELHWRQIPLPVGLTPRTKDDLETNAGKKPDPIKHWNSVRRRFIGDDCESYHELILVLTIILRLMQVIKAPQ